MLRRTLPEVVESLLSKVVVEPKVNADLELVATA